jgi:bacteriocin-like protein
MNYNLGKPLSKKEMKEVQGGKLPGCAMHGQNGVAYSQGCCTGLFQCASTKTCLNPGECPCPDC